MKFINPLTLITLVIVSCGSTSTKGPEPFTLYEDDIEGIHLPFERREMLDDLVNKFTGMSVTKETGQQDGPDFRLYSVKEGDLEICFFAMSPDDSLELEKVFIKQPIIKDRYGLRIGDSYQRLKNLRKGAIKTYTDLHQHTYAYLEASKIMYEISGELSLPDSVDLSNLTLTEEQVKDWRIEYIIWRK